VHRLTTALVAVALLASACTQSGTGAAGALPETDPARIDALLAASTQPVVLNIWGSWCIPCRSEAPLLRAAHDAFGGEVRFVGIAVQDRQAPAREFIDEFGLGGFQHFFDRPNATSASLGGRGVPLTFFFAAGGDLVDLHSGIIDERSLALGIDELLRRGS
jgi:cytochrome c biogenesis protein CcmG/thiol:disulfide interchange protein DsbE